MGSDRKVRLRPHHLMCIHGFQGYGYSSSYVENFWRQLERLKNESETLIEVSFGPDQICSACPHLLDAQTCKEEEKIQHLDRAYIQNLELKNGETMTLDELKKRISQKMTAAIFESSCAPCEWKKLGVCLKALSQMIDVSNKLKVVIFFIFIIQALFGSIIFKTDLLASEVQSVTKARSVQALEEELIIDKTKRLTVFRKITQNIEKKEYKLALEALKSLEKNSRYQEYFHFLSAQAEIGRMKTAIDQKKYANALLSGDQASYHLSQMMISPNLSQDLSSLLLKRGQYLMGETELDLAKCSLKLNKRSKAIQYYERAFQRLSNLNLLVVVTKTAIVNYALLCEKNKNEICTSWILKLSPLVAKTDDAKILERIVAFKKPSIERSISVPYKIDLDLEAFGKGFAAYQKNNFEEAYVIFRDLLKNYPRTSIKLRTKFWMARAAQRSNHFVQSETLYREIIKELPFSYYALLSSWYSGIEMSRMMDAEIPIANSEPPFLSPSELDHLRRAETFIASGVPDLAQLELVDIRQTNGFPNEFLVYLASLNHMAGNHLAVFQILGELTSRGYQGFFSSYGQKLYFPVTHMPLIRSIAGEQKVDPLLVLSIIKQESAFNSDAVSVANAYGLMQLIGPTARDMDSAVEISDLFRPYRNIKLGSKYIKQLLTRYKGNAVFALAAYNAGPGNADKWRVLAGGSTVIEEQIEQIGFRETREYVQNILRNYYWYNRKIYADFYAGLPDLLSGISTKSELQLDLKVAYRKNKQTYRKLASQKPKVKR